MSPDLTFLSKLDGRDLRSFDEAARRLRQHPESERLAAVQQLSRRDVMVALDMAKRVLTQMHSYSTLLDYGLEVADASSVRDWLECVVPRMGVRRVVRRLQDLRAVNPRAVQKARYWLPLFADQPGYSREEVEALGTSTGGGSD